MTVPTNPVGVVGLPPPKSNNKQRKQYADSVCNDMLGLLGCIARTGLTDTVTSVRQPITQPTNQTNGLPSIVTTFTSNLVSQHTPDLQRSTAHRHSSPITSMGAPSSPVIAADAAAAAASACNISRRGRSKSCKAAAAASGPAAVAVVQRRRNKSVCRKKSDDGVDIEFAVTKNPIEYDPHLQTLLNRLDRVRTARSYRRWRAAFLRRLEPHVAEMKVAGGNGNGVGADAVGGVDLATVAAENLNSKLCEFNGAVGSVKSILDTPALSEESVSVKGRLALHKMNLCLKQTLSALDGLVPNSAAEEIERGYTKLHLAAACLRDDFAAYRNMSASAGTVAEMSKTSSLSAIVEDRQMLQRMSTFQSSYQRFCDIMNDMGLYKVMLESAKYADEIIGGSDSDSDDDSIDDKVIVFDVKTGQIGQLHRDELPSMLTAASAPLSPTSPEAGAGDGAEVEVDGIIAAEAAVKGKKAKRALLLKLLERLEEEEEEEEEDDNDDEEADHVVDG